MTGHTGENGIMRVHHEGVRGWDLYPFNQPIEVDRPVELEQLIFGWRYHQAINKKPPSITRQQSMGYEFHQEN